jgi:hypothetical protein
MLILIDENYDSFRDRCRIADQSRKEVLMRLSAWMILFGIGAIWTTAPAQAQTYSPDFPVCLQTYGIDGNYIACGYTTLAQCQASASGRAAQCIINPYYRGAYAGARTYRRRYSGYY